MFLHWVYSSGPYIILLSQNPTEIKSDLSLFELTTVWLRVEPEIAW